MLRTMNAIDFNQKQSKLQKRLIPVTNDKFFIQIFKSEPTEPTSTCQRLEEERGRGNWGSGAKYRYQTSHIGISNWDNPAQVIKFYESCSNYINEKIATPFTNEKYFQAKVPVYFTRREVIATGRPILELLV